MTDEPIHIDAPGLGHLISKIGGFGETFGPVARRLLERSALSAQAEAMKRTPVVTGTLRRSLTTQIDPAPAPVFAKVGTNIVYAPFIEFGERKGRSGTVKRKAGPARMLRDGAAAAAGAIQAAVRQAVAELEAMWRA